VEAERQRMTKQLSQASLQATGAPFPQERSTFYYQGLSSQGNHVEYERRSQTHSMLYKAAERARNEQSFKENNKRLINIIKRRQKNLGMLKSHQEANKITEFVNVSPSSIFKLFRVKTSATCKVSTRGISKLTVSNASRVSTQGHTGYRRPPMARLMGTSISAMPILRRTAIGFSLRTSCERSTSR
jgi:hypothetical protein